MSEWNVLSWPWENCKLKQLWDKAHNNSKKPFESWMMHQRELTYGKSRVFCRFQGWLSGCATNVKKNNPQCKILYQVHHLTIVRARNLVKILWNLVLKDWFVLELLGAVTIQWPSHSISCSSKKRVSLITVLSTSCCKIIMAEL